MEPEGNAAQGRPRKQLKFGAASIERNSEGSVLPCEVLAEFHLRLLNVTVRSTAAAAAAAAAAALIIDRSSCRWRSNADAANAYIRCDYGEITKMRNETASAGNATFFLTESCLLPSVTAVVGN